MNGTITLAIFRKIPLKIHWSFGLLVLFVIYTSINKEMTMAQSYWFGGYFLALFTCVVLHEYGHAYAAEKFGIKTRDIILSPIGGVARLESLPDKPLQELIIAIAGPLVNVVLAFLIYIALFFVADGSLTPESTDLTTLSDPTDFLKYLFILNIVLFVFNLIPAFPMDGGRILRSLLAMKWGRLKATKIASTIGRVLAMGFVAYAIYNNELFLSMIGVFIFLSAGVEANQTKLTSILEELSVKDIMRTNFTRFHLSDTYDMAIDLYRRNIESNFLIFDSLGYVSGTVPEQYIQEAIKRNAQGLKFTEMLSYKHAKILENTSIKDVFDVMNRDGIAIVSVMRGDEIIGVVDRTGINHLLSQK